jgi:hypothetical protein
MKVFGPGVSKNIRPKKKTQFKIDTKEAGKGEVQATVEDAKGNKIPLAMANHGDGTFTCEYEPPGLGNYKVSATLIGVAAPGSPFAVACTPGADVSKVKVEGLEPSELNCFFLILSIENENIKK